MREAPTRRWVAGRRFPIETMLRIHCPQLWWNLSDPAMEEELHERPLYRRFAGLEGAARMPDETTILRFRHLLERHQLTPQLLVCHQRWAGSARPDAQDRHGGGRYHHRRAELDQEPGWRARPEMHQTKKGQQWHFGMKAHIGVDAESGLVHTVIGTAANVNDVTQAAALLHGEERRSCLPMRATGAWASAKRPRA